MRGIHRWPVNSPHKGPVTRQMFPFDDVIMRNINADYTVILYVSQTNDIRTYMSGSTSCVIWHYLVICQCGYTVQIKFHLISHEKWDSKFYTTWLGSWKCGCRGTYLCYQFPNMASDWLAVIRLANQGWLVSTSFTIYIYRSHSVNTKIDLLKFHIYISALFLSTYRHCLNCL